MGIGEHQVNADSKLAEEGCLKPLTNNTNNKTTGNRKPEIVYKVWSTRVPLIVVLVVVVVSVAVVITLIAVLRTGLANKCPEKVENIPIQGETARIIEHPTAYLECPDDWIQYMGKCYYFSDRFDTWTNSLNFCKSHNSSLAHIDSKKELDFLYRFKDDNYHWIGMSREKNDSGWIWSNGTVYNETIFKIERVSLPGDIDYVFLNHGSVKSGNGRLTKKWICNYQK